jgi:hypothetical protein
MLEQLGFEAWMMRLMMTMMSNNGIGMDVIVVDVHH